MKKIIATIATLLALSMVFVGCQKGGNDETGGNDDETIVTPDEVAETLTVDEYGNIITLEDLKSKSETYNTFVLVVKNKSGEDRSGWGCVALVVTDAAAPWGWHEKILGEGEYGQLPPAASLKNGETYEYKFTLEELIAAIEAEDVAAADGVAHRLTAQGGNGVEIIGDKLVAVDEE
ncbi:MAG: hypothetical protein MJ162_03090 [Treponema sp.]|nr:hypothetical protein [Treponema sp.]